ncbi:hypothetical protein ABFS82_12G003800 [Erythranthe guttata]
MEIMESGGGLIRCNDERIYVSVRLRPLNHNEISSGDVSDWECINNNTIVYKNISLVSSERSTYPNAYTFDRIFGSECSTREVYEKGAKDVAISVCCGINATIFAYGQTSSGKTYTMTGITEYAIQDIYNYIQEYQERDFILKFSAMEIYNESVRDLLNVDNTSLRLLDDPERGTIVEKLTEEILNDRDHVTRLLSVCEAQRQIGETSINERSSRSHQIIRLTVESSSREILAGNSASTLSAIVNFVDLAGSERASQSLSAGTRLKEGSHINRSLLTLGTVIRKLSKDRNGHIPYRDSKLTRILQTSLGGNTRTAVICTIIPSHSHSEQSRNTLLFASCAKEVTTNAQVNVVLSEKALVKHLQKEVQRLENELKGRPHNFAPSNYSALLREKDSQIEKLEKEIKELILQRDIARSQVKEFVQLLGDEASSITQVGVGHYPHLRVQNSPDDSISDVDAATCSDGHSRSDSGDNNFAKVPFFDDNFVQNYASPRILLSSSNSSRSFSYNDWEDIEKQSNDDGSTSIVKVHANLSDDREFISSPLKDDNELKGGQEKIVSASIMGGEERDFSSIRYLDIAFLEKRSSNFAKDPFGARSSNLSRSKSCKAMIIFDAEPTAGSETAELSTKQEITIKPETEIVPKVNESSTKEGKKVGLYPIEDEHKGLTSWPVEFKRLQREIIELWHACNVSLVHRTYFFLLFQGDPSDAIYLEVELRRMKFLKDKFARGDKTVVNGKRLTLSSSAKALRQERRTLSEQMMKKFSEQEREILFIEWGIGLNTKLRRLQLANLVWSKTQDINHVTDSAFLVAKLVGFIEPGQQPNKEMLGVNFAPKSSTGIYSFKRSLVSIL